MINKRILTLITLLLFLLLVVGCDVIKPNQPPEITSNPVETATVGVDYTYNVVANDPDAGDILTYSLTTEPEGMLIDEDSGVITWIPDAVGDFDIVVVVSDEDGLSDTQEFTITVNEPVPDPVIELTGIVVDPKTMTLFAGGSEAIESVTATYEIRGTEVPIALGDCTYESDDEEVATVLVGVVTAVTEGTATITVCYGGETDTLEVTVNPVLLTSIVVLPEAMNLSVKGSEPITSVTAHYNDGSTNVVVLGDCTYLSSNEVVATVLAGVVSAIEVGTATITVTYESMTDTVEVMVKSILLTSIVVLPETMTLLSPGSETITSVTAHYSDGTEAEIELSACDYESSDMGVATVVAGVITAVTFGEATVTVSYTEEEITKTVLVEETDTIEVTVGMVHNITKDTYYNTIQLAENDGSYGNTILVAPGTYTENIVIDEAGLNFESSEKHGANIKGSLRIEADGVSVCGFEFTDPVLYLGEYHCIFILAGAEGALIEGNLIDGFGTNNPPTVRVNGVMLNTFGNLVLVSADVVDNQIINVHMGIYAQGNSKLVATGNTIEDMTHCGIGLDTSAGTLITGNTISNCVDQGIEVMGANIVANFNNIAGNPNFGVQSFGPQVDATKNWWGDASGPTHVNNPGGTGDAVSNDVIYVPWSTVEN